MGSCFVHVESREMNVARHGSELHKPRPSLSLKKSLVQQKLVLTVQHEADCGESVPKCADVPYCVLKNIGNTCYVNSVLQVLKFCPGFTASLRHLTLSLQTESKAGPIAVHSVLLAELNETLKKMTQLETEGLVERHSLLFTPSSFVSRLKSNYGTFTGSGQHDAHELLKLLLVQFSEMVASNRHTLTNPDDGMVLQCQKPLEPVAGQVVMSRKRKTSCVVADHPKKVRKRVKKERRCIKTIGVKSKAGPVLLSMHHNNAEVDQDQNLSTNLFQGTVTYRTVCFECECCTQGTENFLDVSLPLLSYTLDCVSPRSTFGGSGPPVAAGPYSLSWALTQFAKRERLQSENKYWCGYCRHLVEAERSVLFSKLPPVLMVHLNRFSMQSGIIASRVSKITGNLATPFNLCLKAWCTLDCPNRLHMYGLFAVIFHTGSSCQSGHYTACVKSASSEWLLFDDDHVVAVSRAKVADMLSPLSTSTSTAYILFYA